MSRLGGIVANPEMYETLAAAVEGAGDRPLRDKLDTHRIDEVAALVGADQPHRRQGKTLFSRYQERHPRLLRRWYIGLRCSSWTSEPTVLTRVVSVAATFLSILPSRRDDRHRLKPHAERDGAHVRPGERSSSKTGARVSSRWRSSKLRRRAGSLPVQRLRAAKGGGNPVPGLCRLCIRPATALEIAVGGMRFPRSPWRFGVGRRASQRYRALRGVP